MTLKTIICQFKYVKDGYVSRLYEETGNDHKIGTLYLHRHKAALNGDTPDTITVTLTYDA